jgi:hypothetical protein
MNVMVWQMTAWSSWSNVSTWHKTARRVALVARSRQ